MAGKPIYDEKMQQRITVRLTPDLVEYATKLGKGKPSTGLRLALGAHREHEAKLDHGWIYSRYHAAQIARHIARHEEHLDAQDRHDEAAGR